jgi:2-haloacid dehalogenase
MPEKWISFDCYGTLIDWRTGMRAAIDIVAPGRAEALLAHHHRIEPEIEQRPPFQIYREVLAQSLLAMAAVEKVVLHPGDEHILATTLPFWPPFPDTGAGLEALQADGWRLAILSNVDRDLIAGTLRHFPVLFDLVITAQDVRSYKPAEGHFRELLRRSGVEKGRWVHAAASWHYDVVTASRLGAHAVWVDREGETGRDTAHLKAVLPDIGGLAATLRDV